MATADDEHRQHHARDEQAGGAGAQGDPQRQVAHLAGVVGDEVGQRGQEVHEYAQHRRSSTRKEVSGAEPSASRPQPP